MWGFGIWGRICVRDKHLAWTLLIQHITVLYNVHTHEFSKLNIY